MPELTTPRMASHPYAVPRRTGHDGRTRPPPSSIGSRNCTPVYLLAYVLVHHHADDCIEFRVRWTRHATRCAGSLQWRPAAELLLYWRRTLGISPPRRRRCLVWKATSSIHMACAIYRARSTSQQCVRELLRSVPKHVRPRDTTLRPLSSSENPTRADRYANTKNERLRV